MVKNMFCNDFVLMGVGVGINNIFSKHIVFLFWMDISSVKVKVISDCNETWCYIKLLLVMLL